MAQNTAAATAERKPKKQKQSQFSGMSKALVRRETIAALSLIHILGTLRNREATMVRFSM